MDKTQIIGIIGADVEVKEISGQSYLFVPVSSFDKRDTGAQKWIKVFINSKTSPIIIANLKKGNSLYIEGKCKYSFYEGKIYRTLWADKIQPLYEKKEEEPVEDLPF